MIYEASENIGRHIHELLGQKSLLLSTTHDAFVCLFFSQSVGVWYNEARWLCWERSRAQNMAICYQSDRKCDLPVCPAVPPLPCDMEN